MITKTTQSLKVGATLIATNVCRMDDGEKTLTIGKKYKIERFRDGTELIIKDDSGDVHYFDLDNSSISYYRKWFKIKK